MRLTIQEAKQRLRIPELWHRLGLRGQPKKSCRCPFHDDHSPSFSLSDDGLLWRCFAGCGGGDAITFLERASNLSNRDACRKFIEMAGGAAASATQPPAPPVIQETAKPRPTFPNFEPGTEEAFERLASLRQVSVEAVRWASSRGLLWFAQSKSLGKLDDGLLWIITDRERLNAQARRMDGHNLLTSDIKAWTLPGSWAAWPIGIGEAENFPYVALVEGGPDLLAAFHFSWCEARNDVAPVAMLGASLKIHPSALRYFKGKHVRILAHSDKAGRESAERWAGQVWPVAKAVETAEFVDLQMSGGTGVKDLNNCTSIPCEVFEDEPTLSYLMP